MIYLGIVAEPLFIVLLGEKWLPSVPYFQILCAVGIMYPLHAYNLNILNVKGRSDLFLKLEIVKKIIITVGIACAIPFGIYGLLYFQLIFSVSAFFINTWYSGRLINYNVGEQLRDILPGLFLAICVGLISWGLDVILQRNGFIDELGRVTTIGIAYFAIYLVISFLSHMPAIIDFRKLVIKK
jgi:O-antigen/teichoic acid export membrane protein